MVLGGGLRGVAEKKERVTRGWRRERRFKGRRESRPLSARSTYFIKVHRASIRWRWISRIEYNVGQREADNQRGFELSRARRRFLRPKPIEVYAGWWMERRCGSWRFGGIAGFVADPFKFESYEVMGVMELEKENIWKERWKNNNE